jgi:altronate dehydratase large subunit
VLKGGASTVRQVVEYAERPVQKGLVIMDSPAHDAVCNTGMIAAGAQVIVFTTGRGTPIGAPTAPVIKVASNNRVFRLMNENIDVNAGDIIDERETIESVGEEIFREVIAVASGKPTRAEALGHAEFALYTMGLNV